MTALCNSIIACSPQPKGLLFKTSQFKILQTTSWWWLCNDEKKRNNMCDKSTYWPSSPSFLSFHTLCKQSSTQPNILASSSQKMIHKINSRADILYNLGCPPQFRSWEQTKFTYNIRRVKKLHISHKNLSQKFVTKICHRGTFKQ